MGIKKSRTVFSFLYLAYFFAHIKQHFRTRVLIRTKKYVKIIGKISKALGGDICPDFL